MPAKPPTDPLADTLTSWARGGLAPLPDGSVPVVLCTDRQDMARLTDPGDPWVGPGTVVLAPRPRRGGVLPTGPGRWVGVVGAFVEPGDELEVSRDQWLQTTDYVSLPYLGVAGPTVVRLCTEPDVAGLLHDAAHLRDRGELPEALLHPLVELGDRCALQSHGGHGLTRLFLGGGGQVRAVPGGEVLGTLDSSLADLARAAGEVERCLPPEVARALTAAGENGRASVRCLLTALEGVRVMTASTGRPWSVGRAGQPRTMVPVQGDVVLLTDNRQDVLFHAPARRAFRVVPEVSRLLASVLTGADRPDLRSERTSIEAAGAVVAQFATLGVPLRVPVAA